MKQKISDEGKGLDAEITDLQRAKEEKDDPEIDYKLARLYTQGGNFLEAVEHYEYAFGNQNGLDLTSTSNTDELEARVRKGSKNPESIKATPSLSMLIPTGSPFLM